MIQMNNGKPQHPDDLSALCPPRYRIELSPSDSLDDYLFIPVFAQPFLLLLMLEHCLAYTGGFIIRPTFCPSYSYIQKAGPLAI